MENNHATIDAHPDTRLKIDKRNAYHEAGHAASIYLGNREKQLPDVHFQVNIKQRERVRQQVDRYPRTHGNTSANVEGGRLIQSLPLSFVGSSLGFTWIQKNAYQRAFEADVTNILAGALAEAKIVALTNGEGFNTNFVNLSTLRFYGGSSDIKVVTEYMECFMPHKAERAQKMIQLFMAAISFVNDISNWIKITSLAEFIRDKPLGIIPCEDVISFLDLGYTPSKATALG
jgi:hypothetical protein